MDAETLTHPQVTGEIKEKSAIRVLGGPKHNLKIADPETERWVWDVKHVYLRIKLTINQGRQAFSEVCYLYFGNADDFHIDIIPNGIEKEEPNA